MADEKRITEYSDDRTTVYLNGFYTFDELLEIVLDNKLSPHVAEKKSDDPQR